MTEPTAMKDHMTSAEFQEWLAKGSSHRRAGNTAGPNKTEQSFFHWRMSMGAMRLLHEPINVRIGPVGSKCWYKPDFMEIPNYVPRGADAPIPILYDVKARGKDGRYRAEDDALVKIKAAAEIHPWARWCITWPAGRGAVDPFEIWEIG